MTVVAGLCCGDGIVIASDSQMSVGATRRFEQKVWVADDRSFAFGLAGNETTMHRLRDHLALVRLAEMSAVDVQEQLISTFGTVLKAEYDRVRGLLSAAQQSDWSVMPIAQAVVGVLTPDLGPQVFHVNELAAVTNHSGQGFASAGSGGPYAEHAITVFRELRSSPLTVFQAEMLAFRVIADSIAIGGPTIAVGGLVQMAVVRSEGALLDDPQYLAVVEDAVTEWRRVEGERFREHQPPGA